jgi:hypothetical protein
MVLKEGTNQMTPSAPNLNAKLSPRPRKKQLRVAATNRHLARPVSSSLIRAAAPRSTYRGGYLIDV